MGLLLCVLKISTNVAAIHVKTERHVRTWSAITSVTVLAAGTGPTVSKVT